MKEFVFLICCILFSQCKNSDRKNTVNVDEFAYDSIMADTASVQEVNDSTSLKIFAGLEYDKDNYSKAIPYFTQLIKIFPLRGEYYYRRGFSYAQTDNDSSAVKDLLKAIEFNYQRFEAYRMLGIIYMLKLIDPKLATYYFEKCLEINPLDEEIKGFLKRVADDNSKSI